MKAPKVPSLGLSFYRNTATHTDKSFWGTSSACLTNSTGFSINSSYKVSHTFQKFNYSLEPTFVVLLSCLCRQAGFRPWVTPSDHGSPLMPFAA